MTNIANLTEGRDYEFVALPSNGECYASKNKAVHVRFMTADDENIFASKALWQNGSIGDELLRRVLLDDNIDVSSLCFGDREALLLHIYRTAYGDMYRTSEGVTVDLSEIPFKRFYQTADNDGFFEYFMEGFDAIKYRYLTFAELKSMHDKEYASESDFIAEYLKLSLKNGLPPSLDNNGIEKLYRFINYTAPGLDTELTLGDTLFVNFE